MNQIKLCIGGYRCSLFGAKAAPAEEWQINLPSEFWQARITGQIGQSNNVEWLHDGEKYSFTDVSKEILHRLVDGDRLSRVASRNL